MTKIMIKIFNQSLTLSVYYFQDLCGMFCLPTWSIYILQCDQDQVSSVGHQYSQMDSIYLHGGPGHQEVA